MSTYTKNAYFLFLASAISACGTVKTTTASDGSTCRAPQVSDPNKLGCVSDNWAIAASSFDFQPTVTDATDPSIYYQAPAGHMWMNLHASITSKRHQQVCFNYLEDYISVTINGNVYPMGLAFNTPVNQISECVGPMETASGDIFFSLPTGITFSSMDFTLDANDSIKVDVPLSSATVTVQ